MLRRLSSLATAAVLVTAVAVAVLSIDHHWYVVTGGSMGRTIPRGSVVLDEVVPVRSLRVGDVITYAPPRTSGVDGLVTHRIVSIRRVRTGPPVFHTKGDGNADADPWRFQLRGERQARVVAHVPFVGTAIAVLSDRRWRMLLIGVPALLIAAAALRELLRREPPVAPAARGAGDAA